MAELAYTDDGPCACAVELKWDEPGKAWGRIEAEVLLAHCPLHAAAGNLLRALESWRGRDGHFINCMSTEPDPAKSQDCSPECVESRAAIAEAHSERRERTAR